jgi:hypothetical protein
MNDEALVRCAAGGIEDEGLLDAKVGGGTSTMC